MLNETSIHTGQDHVILLYPRDGQTAQPILYGLELAITYYGNLRFSSEPRHRHRRVLRCNGVLVSVDRLNLLLRDPGIFQQTN